jgi:hypothetical protein
MRTIEGTLESYGPSVEALGGMRYSYIRIRHDNGQVTNVANIIAFTNVVAELERLIGEDDRKIKLHCKGRLFIYALEHEGGLATNYSLILNTWLTCLFWTFGPLLFGLLLLTTGDHTLKLGGVMVLLIGIYTFVKWLTGCILFWPSSQAGLLPSYPRKAN